MNECVMRMEKLGNKPTIGIEHPCFAMKKSTRRASPRLCCWICIFSVLFMLLACPGLDPLDSRYMSKEYAAYFDYSNFDVCWGRRIYVYDLPAEFNVVVHEKARCDHSLIYWLDLCPRFGNKGYGSKLWNESGLGVAADDVLFDRSNWYDTDSYMLEMIFHRRMQNYHCRTKNSSQADAFYVPYYTGLLSLELLYEKADLKTTYEKRRLFGSEVIEWLEAHGGETWRRYDGRDHFVVMGRTTWDFKVHHQWGTGFSALPYVSNMTQLMLEKSPIMEHEQAIPYPTAFHPDSPERLQGWLERVESSFRRYLFSYVGAPRPDSWSVRGIISTACIDAGESVCNLVNCSVVKCSHEPMPIYNSFLQSTFCLQPRGDTATRRSTFDCLISGAIPVFFHEDTAYSQYSWHLPENARSFSVYIPEVDVKNGTVSIQEVLMGYSKEQIREMQRTVLAMIPNLLYNDYDNDPLSPTKDAFEVSVEKLLTKIATVKKQMSPTYRCWIPFRPRHCFLH